MLSIASASKKQQFPVFPSTQRKPEYCCWKGLGVLNPFGLHRRSKRAALSAGNGTRHRSQRPPQAEAGFLLGDTAEVKATFTPSRTQLAKTKSKTKGRRREPDPAHGIEARVISGVTWHRAISVAASVPVCIGQEPICSASNDFQST